MKLIDARKKVHGWNKSSADGMLTAAISYRSPVKCIAFYKGDQVSDHILDWVIELATHGYITEAGKKLYLIPIKLYEQAGRAQQAKADEHAKRMRKKGLPCNPGPASPSIKKRDCIPLSSFLPKKHAERRARLCQSRVLRPLFTRSPGGANRNAGTLVHIVTNRNAICLYCDEVLTPKRRGAKYCGKSCKQAAYRSRKHT